MNSKDNFDKKINFILNSKAKVFSFDVFDTVLTRTTATPQGIFKLIQNEMKKKTSCNISTELVQKFCYLRPQAEKKAKENTKKESVTIGDIYEILTRKFQLSNEVRDFLINLEIEHELDAVRPIPKIIQILNLLHNQKKRVVFISDIYLPKDIIRRFLKKVEAYKEGDGLYISNEFSMTKKSGRLFKQVLISEDCLPSQMIHVGDDLRSDIIRSKHIGIKSIYFKEGRLNRYENAIIREGKNSAIPNYILELTSGASRLACHHPYKENNSYHTLHSLGANVTGPILLGFVIWVLQNARKYNFKRLYFCSRDGQILLEIAKRVAEYLKFKIDLRYLYLSRQALYLTAATELGKRETEWLLAKDRPLTLSIIAYRAGIEPEVFQNELQKCIGERIEVDKTLDARDINKLNKTILNGRLSSLILSQSREMRMSALNYFRQEGLMEEVKWGIVDLGWQCRTQNSIRKIFNSIGLTERTISGFYFGLNPTKFDENNNNDKRAFFFGLNPPEKLLKFGFRLTRIMEILTAGDHGLTLSYNRDKKGIWHPKLKELRNEKALNWGLEYLRGGIFQFLSFINPATIEELANYINNYQNVVLPLIRLLLFTPSREEAEAIGDYPYYGGLTEIDAKTFAPPFSILTALRYGFNVDYRKKGYLTYWLEGTRFRGNRISRSILSHKSRAILGRTGWIARRALMKL